MGFPLICFLFEFTRDMGTKLRMFFLLFIYDLKDYVDSQAKQFSHTSNEKFYYIY